MGDLDITPREHPVYVGSFFEAWEFDCKSGDPYPEDWVATRLSVLLGVLNPIRAAWGQPVQVVSGYRTPAWNARVGGAPKSQHVEGRAADVRPLPVRGEAYEDRVTRFYSCITGLKTRGLLPELGGLGYYPSRWIHVDVRSKAADGRVAAWIGKGVGSEQSS